MVVFRKIWHALFSLNTRFEIRRFALLPTSYYFSDYGTLLRKYSAAKIRLTISTKKFHHWCVAGFYIHLCIANEKYFKTYFCLAVFTYIILALDFRRILSNKCVMSNILVQQWQGCWDEILPINLMKLRYFLQCLSLSTFSSGLENLSVS